MHGNLWEWTWDSYRPDYENLDPVDPVHDIGPGFNRVLRGGFWHNWAQDCRSTKRNAGPADHAYQFYGMRPVRSVF